MLKDCSQFGVANGDLTVNQRWVEIPYCMCIHCSWLVWGQLEKLEAWNTRQGSWLRCTYQPHTPVGAHKNLQKIKDAVPNYRMRSISRGLLWYMQPKFLKLNFKGGISYFLGPSLFFIWNCRCFIVSSISDTIRLNKYYKIFYLFYFSKIWHESSHLSPGEYRWMHCRDNHSREHSYHWKNDAVKICCLH